MYHNLLDCDRKLTVYGTTVFEFYRRLVNHVNVFVTEGETEFLGRAC